MAHPDPSAAWERYYAAEEERNAAMYPQDDPVCICGVSRSEHALCGCPEGFQLPDSWAQERAFIESLDDWSFDRLYGDD